MQSHYNRLWPYNRALAFAAIPIVWIFFVVVCMLGKKYAGWQNMMQGTIVLIVAAISLLPLLMLLLDFFSDKKAVLDIKGVKIDFSNIHLDSIGVKKASFGLPDNIGLKGQIVTDSAPMQIMETLETAVDHEIAIVDIRNGDAWWVSRLLALCAGAKRAGSPAVIVFTGKKGNILNTFLGWGKPIDLLNEILLDDKKGYKKRYERAMQITRQVLLNLDPDLLPKYIPVAGGLQQNLLIHNDITRYTGNPDYSKLGEAVTEQVILDQLANRYIPDDMGSLEDPPDRLTLDRFNGLFASCIYTDSIDLDSDKEDQVNSLLNSKSPFIGLIQNGQFESILKQSDGERLILKELFNQSKHTNND